MGNATTKGHYSKSVSVGSNSRRTRWEGPGFPAPPGKPLLIPGADDSHADVVAIRWERSPSNGGSAIVGYLVEHRRLGSPHWVRSTPGLCTFPEVTLSGLEPGWRYQFRVRAQNALGYSQPSEISDPLTVTLQRAAASAPNFDLELKDTVVLENEQAEFVVRYSGTPLPKLSWFKDGFEIFSSRRTRIITDNGKSVLLIHQTALNDEGEIKCTATNRAGHVSTKAKLLLEAPPKIRLPRQYEDGLLFEQDETIRLKVSLAGRPPPTVLWYHDGELISKDERHLLETMDNESILKIPDAKRDDRGEYTVKAVNKLGDDASSFLVTVTDRPAAPGKATVTMTLGRSVTLSWKEPEDDGGCKIGTYIVEYYRMGWDVWLKATTSRQTTATLAELIEGSEYKFRVKAENPYGVSEPSEDSDVIFVPDLKRGIVTPSLSGKSQSHREIRSREKREVSFAVPTQRTRSLTREESRTRDDEDNGRIGAGSRSASAQRLGGRPSRADSRVTFALDTLDKSEMPVPPVRSKDHSILKQDNRVGNHVDRSSYTVDVPTIEDTSQKKERPPSPKAVTTVTVSPPIVEESGRRSAFRESRSRSVSVSRERSMSPLSLPKIQEYRDEESPKNSTRLLRPSVNVSLQKQQAVVDELDTSFLSRSNEDKPSSPTTPREDDENALRGSSEFMLVLYPDDQKVGDDGVDGRRRSLEARQSMTEEMEDEEDLIPPPMSLSLPELFSAEHQVIETIREAVSSTELLHERAMERFYRAVAAEEASEVAKRKAQLEIQTGELASLKTDNRKSANVEEDIQDIRRSSLRRRLSNSGVTTQNLITWQAKKNRRRSSEGQAEMSQKAPMKLLSPSLLPDVEARSDPNMPVEPEKPITDVWGRSADDDASTPLRRWHDSTVPLVEDKRDEKSMSWQSTANDETLPSQSLPPENNPFRMETKGEEEGGEEEEESIVTSEESSEEVSSADSDDLKLLKSRILARQVMEEEDTYHPRGTPTPHIEPGPPPVPLHRVPTLEVSSPPAATPANAQPKSILKKRKEEPVPVNSFGRPIPPEKPIRKMPPSSQFGQQEEDKTEDEDTIDKQTLPEPSIRPPVMSESDADSVLSAGEAAKNRRIQAKMRSQTPEEEVDEADIEARMAVVNHYTEIVREHSSRYCYRGSEERKLGDAAGSRRSSVSEDQDQRNQTKNRTESSAKTPNKEVKVAQVRSAAKKEVEVQQVQPSVKQKKNEVDQQERQGSQQPSSRRGSVSSPAPPALDINKEKRGRPPSRNESPGPRSRTVSVERRGGGGGTSSRSSSKTRVRTPSQDRSRRTPSRNGSEEPSVNREKSIEDGPRRSKVSSRPSSRTSSRSNSRDRQKAETPVEMKMERLQKALESKKYRSLRRGSTTDKDHREETAESRLNAEQLAIEARKNVRCTVDYVTDLGLLMAAIYVYLFKKEILAIPFIALLLYRKIQQEIRGRALRGWWWSKRKQS